MALSSLKADASLTAIVPASRIYPQTGPASTAWPFVKFGAAQSLPIRASCIDGETVSFTVHAFAKGSASETAEDQASRIGSAIRDVLDKAKVAIPGGSIRFRISDRQLFPDGAESGAFHCFAVVNARAMVSSA